MVAFYIQRIIVHLQLPHFLLKADSDTNGDLQTVTICHYWCAKIINLPMGTFTCSNQCNDTDLLQSYLHLPHFLLKVHQLVLKASSDANGDLCIVKLAEKGSYSPPADPSQAPASLSLCPEGLSPAGVQVVKWLLDCLTFSSTPLCLFVTHPPIFWTLRNLCLYFFQVNNIYFLLLLFPYFWFHHLINSVGNMASLESWFNFICSKH